MKTILGLIALFLAIFFAFPIQEMIPPVSALHGARLLLVPALFCYGAVALSTPAMLALAVFTGLFTDLAYLHVVAGQVEIAVGWSIVFFVILGLVANGLQPAFQRGQWWIPIPLTLVVTSLFLLLQFAMISLRREGFFFNEVVVWRILGAGVLSSVVAMVIHPIAMWSGYFIGDSPMGRSTVLAKP
ncbi:MAG: hypothetical protein WEB60_10035 [Terrimicrobiaceae bacterium]